MQGCRPYCPGTCIHEQGLDALISPPSGQVCHSLIVVLYCVPGISTSPCSISNLFHSSLAGIFFITLPSVRAFSSQSSSFPVFQKMHSGYEQSCLNSGRLLFGMLHLHNRMAYPAAINAATFFSSSTFQLTKSTISG